MAQAILGVYAHAVLAGRQGRQFRQVLDRDDWTCHACSIRIPGAMEIDHLSGQHTDSSPTNLKAICSYCHLGRHPGAAAAEERFTPIWFPELEQHEVNRLAWAHLATSTLAPESDQMRDIYDHFSIAIEERQSLAEEMLGLEPDGPFAEAFIEVLFSARRELPAERETQLSDLLRRELRYWPTENILVWRAGRSVNVKEEIAERLVASGGPFAEVNLKDLWAMSRRFGAEALTVQTELATRAAKAEGVR
ncbi:HNH endonuclease signature motif containing protein [Amorphus sp. 3PC139-8]|uniref:HNH endonuclease signature motif containing protein n=1 Tax=Amorphus sp. 3PC139-8 TaxID=2735676 RepID=UPI00345CED23